MTHFDEDRFFGASGSNELVVFGLSLRLMHLVLASGSSLISKVWLAFITVAVAILRKSKPVYNFLNFVLINSQFSEDFFAVNEDDKGRSEFNVVIISNTVNPVGFSGHKLHRVTIGVLG